MRIIEGETTLRVPESSIKQREPPTYPVFYNPAAKLNRDISIIIVSCTSGSSFADMMAGLGARSVRIAKEIGREIEIHANDINKRAIVSCKVNAKLNNVEDMLSFSALDMKLLSLKLKSNGKLFDYVDIDPFGSPAFYILHAIEAVRDGGILSVTATDTAVLCGPQRRLAERRYLAKTMHSSFTHETGLRILIGFVCRIAGLADRGCFPILGHSSRHYLRAYFALKESATEAEKAIEELGYIVSCRNCLNVYKSKEVEKCIYCNKEAQYAGPLWIGRIADKALLRRMKHEAERRKKMKESEKLLHAIERSDGLPPYSFRIEDFCSSIHVPSVPYSRVKEILESMGFRCEIQPYEKSGIKTDASYHEVLQAVKEASKPNL